MKPGLGRWWMLAALLLLMLLAAPASQLWRPARTDRSATYGLPPLNLPADVVLKPARIELGRKLFFDRRLSFNGSMSCAMCHVPEEGFTSQASRTGVGIEGKSLKRNAPSLLNVAWQTQLFHDGRESALSTQAWMPLLHADEMANPSIGFVLQRLLDLPDYAQLFQRSFAGRGPSMHTVGAALAAFEASLVAANSRFDRWRYGADSTALNALEQRGFVLFTGPARCSLCHRVDTQHALLADGEFHVTGVGFGLPAAATFSVALAEGLHTLLRAADVAAFDGTESPDLGRYEISLDPADRYAFKTPSLRNVAHTPPYMHDGSLATLEAVIEFYNQGGGPAPGKDAALQPLALSPADKAALLAFLRALDGADLPALMAHSRPATTP